MLGQRLRSPVGVWAEEVCRREGAIELRMGWMVVGQVEKVRRYVGGFRLFRSTGQLRRMLPTLWTWDEMRRAGWVEPMACLGYATISVDEISLQRDFSVDALRNDGGDDRGCDANGRVRRVPPPPRLPLFADFAVTDYDVVICRL